VPTPRQIAAAVLLCTLSLARADIVVVVPARSPVQKLSEEQVADLFLGRAAVPVPGGALEPIDLAEGRPERDDFYRRIAAMSAPQLTAYWARMIFTGRGKPPREVGDEHAVKEQMARNPHLLAYLPRQDVDDTMRIVFVPR
jgi:hypothetical protein